MTRQLAQREVVVTTTTGKYTLTAAVDVDEYGYWLTGADGELLLHVAHGALVTIEPCTGPVPSKAETARDKLLARAGR